MRIKFRLLEAQTDRIYVGMEPDQYKASDALTPLISTIPKFTASFFIGLEGMSFGS